MSHKHRVTSLKDVANWSPEAQKLISEALGTTTVGSQDRPGAYKPIGEVEQLKQRLHAVRVLVDQFGRSIPGGGLELGPQALVNLRKLTDV